MKRIVGIALTVAAVVILVMAVVVAFPGLFPPLRSLILDRVGWVRGEAGSPEDAWEYAKDKVLVPPLQTKVEPSGSSVRIAIESDRDVVVFTTVTGPLGEQKLADGVVRRFRTVLRELPDGEYTAEFLARRCVGLSGKPAEYKPEACQETAQTEEFVIDTTPPVPTGDFWVWHQKGMVVITGSTEDLSGLKQAYVSKVCVAAEDGAFELQVPLKAVNRQLRKYAAIQVGLTDAVGNCGEPVGVVPPTPSNGWIVVDGEDRLRSIGRDDGGLGGNPPAWTTKLLEDGQVLEAFGSTEFWYYGVRIVPFLAFLLAIISWRARTTLIEGVAGLLLGLADLLDRASSTPTVTEES